MKEAFYRVFTADPVNWLKWGIVFAVLIGSYIFTIPLYRKLHNRLGRERKRDIARSRGHIVEAKLISKYPTGAPTQYDWYGKYSYTLDGVEKRYTAYFTHPQSPPRVLYLYYLNDPKKLFSFDEYHWDNHKAVILAPVMLLPWMLAVMTVIILQIPIS